MKRFTASADPDFMLEAEGRPPLRLHAGTGGVTSGSTRFVVLVPEGEPLRGVSCALRAMNANRRYAWRLALTSRTGSSGSARIPDFAEDRPPEPVSGRLRAVRRDTDPRLHGWWIIARPKTPSEGRC
jgi:hypothetical protein